jgi:Na+/melibiose symporter-like transporter
MPENNEKKHVFDDPRNVKRVIGLLVGVCTVLVLADLFYAKHVHYGAERWFGFYGFYGFVGCVFLVLAAKELRKLVMREEDYYDR